MIKVAIVGVGHQGFGWGGIGHVPAIRATPGFELRAICTSHPTTAARAAEQFGVPRAYSSVAELVRAEDVDLVTVATRPRFRHPVVRVLIDAGKPVYSEWPLGMSSVDAAEMATFAAARNVPTAVGLQAVHAPIVRGVRAMIERGVIGRPLAFHATELMPRPALRSDQWWVHTRSDDAAVHGVVTAHLAAVVESLLGPIRSLCGRSSTLMADDRYADGGAPFAWTASDTVSFQALLSSGAEGTIHLSWTASVPSGFQIDIFGEDGQVRLASPLPSGLGPTRADWAPRRTGSWENLAFGDPPPETFAELGPSSISCALAAIRDCWAASEAFRPDFHDGCRLHRLLDAIERSSVERAWVDLV